MHYHYYGDVVDLAAKLDREGDLWSRPFRLDVDPVGEIVTGYTFIDGRSTEPVIYASDDDGNMIKDGYGRWETADAPMGWHIVKLCEPSETLRGDVLRDLMDTAADAAPESIMIYCVEYAYIDMFAGTTTGELTEIGWVILSRDVDATTVAVDLTSVQVREGDGHPYLVSVPIPAGWDDPDLDDRITITTTDGATYTGTVSSVQAGRSVGLDIDPPK